MADIHEQAEKDYKLGMKYKDIAGKYNVSLDTVKKWKTRHKWTRDKGNSVYKEKCTQVNKKCTPKKAVNKLPAKIEHVTKEDDGLTEKQRFFCICYVKNFNATLAAIKAGYSKSYASEIGYQLLQKTTVRNEVERLKAIKRQSIMISEDDIVERYMQIAFADMTDVAEWGTELIPDIDIAGNMQIDKDGNVKMHRRNYMDFKNHDQVDGGLICEISLGRQGI
jgi:phage terminase small subunit